MDYSGTPLETEYDRIKRRREVFKAMQDRAMQQHQNEIVGGQVVKYSPWEGMAQLGSSYLAAKGQKGADKQEEALGNKYRQGVAEAIQRVQGIKEGQNYGPQGPMIPQPNPEKAQLEAAADPFLGSNAPVQAALLSQSKAAIDAKGNPSYQAISTPSGVKVFDRRSGQFMTPAEAMQMSQYDPTLQGQIANAKATGSNQSDLAYKPAIEGAKTAAQLGVEGQMKPGVEAAVVSAKSAAEHQAELANTRPKVEANIASIGSKNKMLEDTIDLAKDQTGAWTSGLLGAATSWIPGTPAANLGATLQTVKSNIGFDKLQEMRNNSKTGGALGQVSEFENRLLQSVWSNLEQSQSPQQLKDNLEKVKKQVQESWKRINDAYKADYGTEYGGSMPKAGNTKAAGVIPEGWSEEEWNVLTDEERKSLQ